jgi:flagellar protein FliS
MRYAAAKAYADNAAQTSVNSANPKELIVLVYEKIFENLRAGKIEITQGRYGIDFFTKASDLINLGLLASLDYQKGGEISKNLKTIYEWALKKINEARVEKSSEKVQNVIDIMIPLYEGWKQISNVNMASTKLDVDPLQIDEMQAI